MAYQGAPWRSTLRTGGAPREAGGRGWGLLGTRHARRACCRDAESRWGMSSVCMVSLADQRFYHGVQPNQSLKTMQLRAMSLWQAGGA
eukprot:scaffold12437_cov58-Phaeocystis_antarctica.AAC.2